MKKRILFTTHHLVNFTGSEIAIFDLAQEFIKLSYDVTVVTFVYGSPIKDFYDRENIRVVNILQEDLEEREFDLIWTQHAPVLYYCLFEQGITADYIIASSLSPYEPLEAPPIFANDLSICLANSEENKKQLKNDGVLEEKIQVFLNSVPIEFFNFYKNEKRVQLNRVIVVSNHVPKEVQEVVELLKITDINVDIYGMGFQTDFITAEKLQDYDAIISIGRTVQYGLAMGIPVYCYDHFGGPGWINKENIDLAEFYNFSGRCTNRKIYAESIAREIVSGYNSAFNDMQYINLLAKQRYSLAQNIQKVLLRIKASKRVILPDIHKCSVINRHNQCYIRELRKDLENKNIAQDIPFQVFWLSKGIYTENKSKSIVVKAKDEKISIELVLPSEATSPLRIDPANCPAYIEFESIHLTAYDFQNKSALLVNCSGDNGFSGLSVGRDVVFLESNSNYKIMSIGGDPQLFLNWNCDVKSVKTFYLQIIMRVNKCFTYNSANSLSNNINVLHNQIREQIDKLSRSEIELLNSKMLLSQQAQLLDTGKAELLTMEELIRQQTNKLVKANMEIQQIINSHSWKITAPLRCLGHIILKFNHSLSSGIDLLTRRVYRPNLVPIKGIIDRGLGMWESIDNDPQFLLRGTWPKGWTFVSWVASSEKSLPLRLYIDRGFGFNEMDGINLGTVNNEYPTKGATIIFLGPEIKSLRLDPGEGSGLFNISQVKIIRVSKLEIFLRTIWIYCKRRKLNLASIRYNFDILLKEGPQGLWRRAKQHTALSSHNATNNGNVYQEWIHHYELAKNDIRDIGKKINKLSYKPMFSVIVPVYNVDEQWLRKCIESVQAQLYSNWELCIADDASTHPSIKGVLEEYAAKDNRIKIVFREKNGHISAASNSALEIATGEFIALLDNDDELSPDALYENAVLINDYPNVDMIYSDEDKITEAGKRHSPFFKPDWSPDTFLSQMYTCHLGVYRTEIVRQIGGFRKGFEGSQDYDLVLRLTEKTKNIYHIPKVLYHWRTVAQSTALNAEVKSYAHLAGLKAIEEALLRRGESGWVESADNIPNLYRVHYNLKGNPLISIIIPTRDMSNLLSACIDSVFNKSTYQNYELIVMDNGSVQQETFDLFNKWKKEEPKRFRVERLDIPFNFSILNNEGVRLSKGELILLLNNDIEVITPNWLEEMAGQALRDSIGVVGTKLLYPDNTVQHAGVVLGIGGVAGHGHKGCLNSDSGYFGTLAKVTNVSAVTGACLMIKKELFNNVGGLDEELKVAFNDVDFCLKVLDKGLYNVVLPHVQLYHYESKSRGYEDTPEKQERFCSEVKLMQERWRETLVNEPFYNPNLTLDREDFSLK